MTDNLNKLFDAIKDNVTCFIDGDSILIKHSNKDTEKLIKKTAEQLNINITMEKKNKCNSDCPICRGENPIVRVAGFSAYFMDMHKEVQDQIIARTKQRL